MEEKFGAESAFPSLLSGTLQQQLHCKQEGRSQAGCGSQPVLTPPQVGDRGWSGQLKASAELPQILQNLKRHHREVHGSLPAPGWEGGPQRFLRLQKNKTQPQSSLCAEMDGALKCEITNYFYILYPKYEYIEVSNFPFSVGGVLGFKALHFWSHSCHCPLDSRAHSELHLKNFALLFASHEQGREKKQENWTFLSHIPCKPLIFLSRAERIFLLYFYVPASNE